MSSNTYLNIDALGIHFEGWKATAAVLAIWCLPAVAGFALGYAVR